jgi:hypothetical protein
MQEIELIIIFGNFGLDLDQDPKLTVLYCKAGTTSLTNSLGSATLAAPYLPVSLTLVHSPVKHGQNVFGVIERSNI